MYSCAAATMCERFRVVIDSSGGPNELPLRVRTSTNTSEPSCSATRSISPDGAGVGLHYAVLQLLQTAAGKGLAQAAESLAAAAHRVAPMSLTGEKL